MKTSHLYNQVQSKVNSKKGRNMSNYLEQSKPPIIEPLMTVERITPLKAIGDSDDKQDSDY